MIDPEIIQYIRRHIGRHHKEQIRQGLLTAGVPPKAVEQAFREEAATRQAPPAPKPVKKGRGWKITLAVTAVLLVIGFFAARAVNRMIRSPDFQAKLRQMAGAAQPSPAGRRAARTAAVPAGGGFQTYITLAWKASNRGDHKAGIRLATLALNEPVPKPQAEQAKKAALGLRAYCREKSGGHAGALADYRALAELDPSDADARYGLARVYLSMKDYAKALAEARRMSALDPKRPEGHAIEAAAHANTGGSEEAIGKYTLAIHLGKKGGLAAKEPAQLGNWHFNRGVLLANSRKRGQALQDISRAVELAPDEAYYRTVRAKLYEAAGKAAQASMDREAAGRLGAKSKDAGRPAELSLGLTLPTLERR